MNTNQEKRICNSKGDTDTWTPCTLEYKHEGKCNSNCPCPPHVTKRLIKDGPKVCIHCRTVVQLYAIAYEARIRFGVWKPDFLYLHAASDGDARWQFLNSESPATMRHMRIVGVAPVLGYLVNDNHGEDLSV